MLQLLHKPQNQPPIASMVVNMHVKDVSTLVLVHAKTLARDVGMDVKGHARTHALEAAVLAVVVNIVGCAQLIMGTTFSE